MWLAQITGLVCRADLLSPWLFLWQTVWLPLVKPLYFFLAILFTVEENTHWSDLIFAAICWICRLLPHTSGLPFSSALKCKLFQSGADQNLRRTQSRTTRVCWTPSRHHSRRDPSSSRCPRLIFHSRPSHSIAIVFFFLSFFSYLLFLACGLSPRVLIPSLRIKTLPPPRGTQLEDAEGERELSLLITTEVSQLQEPPARAGEHAHHTANSLLITYKCHGSRSKYQTVRIDVEPATRSAEHVVRTGRLVRKSGVERRSARGSDGRRCFSAARGVCRWRVQNMKMW